jgi:quercetin dioxygenase-like cupin family protein
MPRNAPMWFVNEPQPNHHVTVPMPVEGMPEGWTARVLSKTPPSPAAL